VAAQNRRHLLATGRVMRGIELRGLDADGLQDLAGQNMVNATR
jgi:hypothetical protein